MLSHSVRRRGEPLVEDDRARILMAPLFLLNGDIGFDDSPTDEDNLLAEASDMIPTCVAGIHEFWRNYLNPAIPPEVEAGQEAVDGSDAADAINQQPTSRRPPEGNGWRWAFGESDRVDQAIVLCDRQEAH